MKGWIKVYRDIRDHWIWKDERKLKWWLDIIMEVNHEDKKVPIGFKIFDCKRGQSLNSLKTWGDRWNVSKTVVNNFFTMLESDNMIKTENLTQTTRMTICNYETYQGEQNANKTQTTTQTKRKKTQQSLNKNEKNEKNEKKSLHALCKNYFHEYYFKKKEVEYYWEAKDGFAINQLLNKIKKFTGDNDQKIEAGFIAYLQTPKDKWIEENLSVTILNSKFNEIIARAKGSDKLSDLKKEVGYETS